MTDSSRGHSGERRPSGHQALESLGLLQEGAPEFGWSSGVLTLFPQPGLPGLSEGGRGLGQHSSDFTRCSHR